MNAEMGSARSKSWVLWTTSIVSSLIMLDSNIVAVSLPAIARSLGASFQDVQWVISAYLLAYAALLLAAGAAADLWGRKKAMIVGLVTFAGGSIACGLADSSTVLNIARAVQGVGGSLLLTASLAIITHTFTGADRAKAFAVWGAWIGIALVAGPILGGTITSFAGWRWIFLVNVPICVLLIIATVWVVGESKDAEATKLDIAGVVTFSPGLFLLVWALIDGNDSGWSSFAILGRFAGAALFFAIFVGLELRQKRPMIDFSLFRQPTFLGAVFAMLGYGAAAQVMVFTLPMFLQNAYGFRPVLAGLAMLPFAVPMVLAPRLVARYGEKVSARVRLTAGLLICFAGNIFFWRAAEEGATYGIFIFGMLVGGVGAGILNGETVKVMGSAVPPERAGMASGLASTTRFIGILVGTAVLGAVLASTLRHQFLAAASRFNVDGKITDEAVRLISAGNAIHAIQILPASSREALSAVGMHAFAHGFGAGALVAAIAAAVACALTFWFVRPDGAAAEKATLESDGHCQLIDCRHPI